MSLFWHTNDDAAGRAWNTRAVIAQEIGDFAQADGEALRRRDARQRRFK